MKGRARRRRIKSEKPMKMAYPIRFGMRMTSSPPPATTQQIFVRSVFKKWFVATSKLNMEKPLVSNTEGEAVSMYLI